MNFDQAFEKLTSPTEEGGYVDHRADPGGKTRYGITEKTARAHGYTGDMKDLPLSFAKMVYQNDYWRASGCESLPDFIRYPFFSFYVNAKPSAVVKALQRAAGMMYQDGILGPNTLQAISSVPPERLLRRSTAARMLYYTSCYDWPAFGRGWTVRECNNVLNSTAEA